MFKLLAELKKDTSDEPFSISYDDANQNSTLNHSDVDRPVFSPQLQPISTISQPDASHTQNPGPPETANEPWKQKAAEFEQLSKEKNQADESQMKVLRAVQVRVMLAKAMVEAIFSRHVLSNEGWVRQLQIKKRVGETTANKKSSWTFAKLVLPCQEDSKEDAWTKITDEIDVTCRGIAGETKKRGARKYLQTTHTWQNSKSRKSENYVWKTKRNDTTIPLLILSVGPKHTKKDLCYLYVQLWMFRINLINMNDMNLLFHNQRRPRPIQNTLNCFWLPFGGEMNSNIAEQLTTHSDF